MTPATETHPGPLIIRVPPPAQNPFVGKHRLIVIILTIAFLGFGVFFMAIRKIEYRLHTFMAIMNWSGACLLMFSVSRTNRRYMSEREELVKGLPTAPSPAAAELAKRWRHPSEPPDLEEILEVVTQSRRVERAQIVCLGMVQVPEADDLPFAPKVLPGARFLLQGAYSGSRWGRRSLRIAPGILQVIERGLFPFSRSRRIRTYPMTAETIVVISGIRRLTLTLTRGENRDTLALWQVRKPREQLACLWSALLSGAPTPPLSDEELRG